MISLINAETERLDDAEIIASLRLSTCIMRKLTDNNNCFTIEVGEYLQKEEVMNTVKMIGMIFLALYLVITGFVGILGIAVSFAIATVLQLLAIGAGVFMFISVGKCCSHCDNCEKK